MADTAAARTRIWLALLIGGCLTVVATLWVSRDVAGGLSVDQVQAIFEGIAQLYLPLYAQIGAHYWAEQKGHLQERLVERGAQLFTLVILVLYAFVPAGIIFFAPSVEVAALLLGGWTRSAALALASAAVAFFFSSTAQP
jgi:hypothetical protein